VTTEGAAAVLEMIARHARRVVHLSSSGVNDDAERRTDPTNQLHADMERLIGESGLRWTVPRSNTIGALREEGHEGATYVLTGPQVLSRSWQVQAIAEAIGRPVASEKVPVHLARRQMLADGGPPALVEALLAGVGTRPVSHVITSTVGEITGVPARTFHAWAAERAEEFR
jgi:uncharacterized protein YbjT (DUF2867 family)